MAFQFAAFADESATGLTGQMQALMRNGYQHLEIRNVDGKSFTTLTCPQAKEIAATLAENGLSVCSVGSPIGKIPVDGDFDAHLELYKHTLELANIFGARYIRLFSFFMPKDEDPENYRGQVLDRMGLIAEMAANTGITACHENEKGIYGDTAARCHVLHQAIPELKAVFDPANFIQCGQDTLQAWQLLAPYVQYMHIKDAFSDGTVVAPGKGEGNLPLLLQQYKNQGGSLLTLEPHLYAFAGLKSLEQEGDESVVGGMAFTAAEKAFDHAAACLNNILEDLT